MSLECCAGCGAYRSSTDMVYIDAVPYCHPSSSDGTTCYMTATWEAARPKPEGSAE